jgi:hypothetical protein
MASCHATVYKYFACLQINQHCIGLKCVSYSITQAKTQLHETCTNSFISAHFYIENIIDLCYKTSYLNEEVN